MSSLRIELDKQKIIVKGARFNWCPQNVKKCRKIKAFGSPTGYVFVGFLGKVKVCSCYGRADTVKKFI